MKTTFALAVCEFRSSWRLARTWVYAALVLVTTVGSFAFYGYLENLYSSVRPGRFGMRFTIGELGVYPLLVALLAVVFVAFDIQARDERDRIAEALESRPLSNVALIAGRVAGVALITWLPLALSLGLVTVLGGLAGSFDWWLGESIEPLSLGAFVVVDAPANLLLASCVVSLLAVALRNRTEVVAAALLLLGAAAWWLPRVPVYLLEAVFPVSGYASPASDFASRLVGLEELAQRSSMLVVVAGLVAVAVPSCTRAWTGRRVGRGRCPARS